MSTKLENVQRLYLEGIGEGNVPVVRECTGERYTQHNTHVKDGIEGFTEFFNDFIRRNPVRDIQIIRGFVDANMVFVHAFQNLNNGEAKWVTFDFFDTDWEDKVIEHWDVLAEYSNSTPSGHTSVDGPSEVTDLDKTNENKLLVRSMIHDVLMPDGNPGNIGRYISSKQYVQHNRDVADGVEPFRGIAIDPERKLWYDEIYHLVGSGNFVATLCRARWDGEPYAQADLFRVEDGFIVEHWDAAEKIPPKSEWVNTGKF